MHGRVEIAHLQFDRLAVARAAHPREQPLNGRDIRPVQPDAVVDELADLFRGDLLRLYMDDIRAHRLNRREDLTLRAFADRHHRDHRSDPEDDPEQGQHRAQRVRPQLEQTSAKKRKSDQGISPFTSPPTESFAGCFLNAAFTTKAFSRAWGTLESWMRNPIS